MWLHYESCDSQLAYIFHRAPVNDISTYSLVFEDVLSLCLLPISESASFYMKLNLASFFCLFMSHTQFKFLFISSVVLLFFQSTSDKVELIDQPAIFSAPPQPCDSTCSHFSVTALKGWKSEEGNDSILQ